MSERSQWMSESLKDKQMIQYPMYRFLLCSSYCATPWFHEHSSHIQHLLTSSSLPAFRWAWGWWRPRSVLAATDICFAWSDFPVLRVAAKWRPFAGDASCREEAGRDLIGWRMGKNERRSLKTITKRMRIVHFVVDEELIQNNLYVLAFRHRKKIASVFCWTMLWFTQIPLLPFPHITHSLILSSHPFWDAASKRCRCRSVPFF